MLIKNPTYGKEVCKKLVAISADSMMIRQQLRGLFQKVKPFL